MDLSPANYLRYLHVSLADASRITLNLKINPKFALSQNDVDAGQVPEDVAKKLFQLAKKQFTRGDKNLDDDQLWPLEVVVFLKIFKCQPEHALKSSLLPDEITPIIIAAKMGKNGRLFNDAKNISPVFIPRELLEPNAIDVAIGTVEAADKAYALAAGQCDSWQDLLKVADRLLVHTGGSSLEDLAIEGYQDSNSAYIALGSAGSFTMHIERLVDLMRQPETQVPPLFAKLLVASPDKAICSPLEQLQQSRYHIAQMDRRFGLSMSQREALMHHLAAPAGEADILAIDGPPGTGKTTLLLSVIANLWTQRALDKADPPLIVAASTNSNAVINVLEAFAKVKEPENPKIAGRWLTKALSYGLSLPSKSKYAKESEEDKSRGFPIQTLIGSGSDASYDLRVYETREGLETARAEYLRAFKAAYPGNNAVDVNVDLHKAVETLHGLLDQEVESIRSSVSAMIHLLEDLPAEPTSQADITDYEVLITQENNALLSVDKDAQKQVEKMQNIHLQWKKHLQEEKWWVQALSAIGIWGARMRRDASFCDKQGIDIVGQGDRRGSRDKIEKAIKCLLLNAQMVHEQTQKKVAENQTRKKRLTEALQVLSKWVSTPEEFTFSAVQKALDIRPRFDAFKLATHYWEGRYLIELQTHFSEFKTLNNSKSPAKLLALYRRLSMVHPCFVSTLHNLPDRFIGYPNPTQAQALFGSIDLLIIDEAGQIVPEIGAASFALAKRALVVGDVDQIEPIWSLPQSLDGVNALQCKLINDKNELDEFYESGISASIGSIMRLAQRATAYVKHPERGRGMFLSEHRRCWPEIISMCNVLVYQGLLKPCRTEGPRLFLPSLGYGHVPGIDSTNGGSRSNATEAMAIARWLNGRSTQIVESFSSDKKPLAKLVGVITPFTAQSRAIQAALNIELGAKHGITVGTLHALQGAERRVIIFSPTYGLNAEGRTAFFNQSRSMLNVAISRAQDAFLIIGNMHLFRPSGAHPSAVIGRMLFSDGSNELPDIPADLFLQDYNFSPVSLVADLEGHRRIFREALGTAQQRVIIVSPYIALAAIAADDIAEQIRATVARGVRVKIISDPMLNAAKQRSFEAGIESLRAAGAAIHLAQTQGVHSKLILVDHSWLTVGSFNWLSAVRDPIHPYARYESSMRYDGEEAFQMIASLLQDLAPIISAA